MNTLDLIRWPVYMAQVSTAVAQAQQWTYEDYLAGRCAYDDYLRSFYGGEIPEQYQHYSDYLAGDITYDEFLYGAYPDPARATESITEIRPTQSQPIPASPTSGAGTGSEPSPTTKAPWWLWVVVAVALVVLVTKGR